MGDFSEELEKFAQEIEDRRSRRLEEDKEVLDRLAASEAAENSQPSEAKENDDDDQGAWKSKASSS